MFALLLLSAASLLVTTGQLGPRISRQLHSLRASVAQSVLPVRFPSVQQSTQSQQWLLRPTLSAGLQSRIEDRLNQPEAPKKKSPKIPKHVIWNFDGGKFFATDGHLQNGSCFRLSGNMNAPDFFTGLRRIDTPEGSTYTLHDKVVANYPDEVTVVVHILDFVCTNNLHDSTPRPPLTREIMSNLRLKFFWKDHLALRPVESSQRTAAEATQIVPFAQQAEDLAPRFQWDYLFTVKSEGVPLTEDLVLMIEEPDHKIAARVAARL